MKTRTSAFQIGILGGGQLSKMLLEPADRLGVKTLVYTNQSSDPAAQICRSAVFGESKDLVSLRRFLTQVSVCIFENEFVDCELLKAASKDLKLRFVPALTTMSTLQNKLRQKKLLEELQIPFAPYSQFDSLAEPLRDWVTRMLSQFKRSCVFKWAELGYDGKGTLIVGPQTPESEILQFCVLAHEKKLPLFVEEKISFVRELAIIGVYSTAQEFAAYPLVISEQEKGICRKVYGPATLWGVHPDLERQARDAALKIAQKVELHGSFGIEFFETAQGELLVNELAPRVHNTGHYTQDASQTSQFENHVRAVLGMPLGNTQSDPCFGMLNILGLAGVTANSGLLKLPRPTQQSHLHWYGKSEIRPGRKLGHFSLSAKTPDHLQQIFNEIEILLEEWAKEIQS